MTPFLAKHGWSAAHQTPLVQDASSRSYIRLSQNEKTAILMQDPDGDVMLFANLATHLTDLGLSAPRIYAASPQEGLLLIEDLGDDLVAKLATTPEAEQRLYLCATDALVALQRHPAPTQLPVATPERLAAMIDLAFSHYGDAAPAAAPAAKALLPALERHAVPNDVMILRDYHAENVLYLPDRVGAKQAGLLDFQDAMLGHRAYDLASLLWDARRDVGQATQKTCIAHYLAQTGQEETGLNASLSVLSAQRNLRILGVFARLAQARAKPHYIDLIPRVWGHVQTALRHPELADLRQIVNQTLPPPDRNHLERLKSPCQTP